MSQALRLVLFDATQRGRKPRALGLSWQLGATLYRGLGRIDAAYGARSFADAFHWLSNYEPGRPNTITCLSGEIPAEARGG